MDKQEFIGGLRTALNGKIPSAMVEDHVDYYQEYINVEMRKGRTEEEVLVSLGDPRLIARTIVQTSGGQENVVYEEPERNAGFEEAGSQHRSLGRGIRLPGWLMTIIGILAVILVASLLFSVLSFLAPMILMFLAVFFMVKLFRDWLN